MRCGSVQISNLSFPFLLSIQLNWLKIVARMDLANGLQIMLGIFVFVFGLFYIAFIVCFMLTGIVVVEWWPFIECDLNKSTNLCSTVNNAFSEMDVRQFNGEARVLSQHISREQMSDSTSSTVGIMHAWIKLQCAVKPVWLNVLFFLFLFCTFVVVVQDINEIESNQQPSCVACA